MATPAPTDLPDPPIQYKSRKWKKLENSLMFIKKSKSSAGKSKDQNSFPNFRKRSKWILLRNIVSAANFLSRFIYLNLKIES